MKKKWIILIASVSTLAVAGLIVGLCVGLSNRVDKEALYQQGYKYLCDGEYKEAASIFGKWELKGYKDSNKKYCYSIDLQRYEQDAYSYEELIDYGMEAKGCVANVDFLTEGGEAIPRKTITQRSEDKYINEVAVKEHYDFKYWSLNYATYEIPTDSIRYVLKSNYDDHRYQINYDLDGGELVGESPDYYLYKHGDVSVANASKKGYTFTGYESNLYEDTRANFVIPNGTDVDIDLEATYIANTYHIILNASPAVIDETQFDVTYGSDVTSVFPVPSLEGYAFEGWYFNDKAVDLTSFNIDRDTTLYAHFALIKYRVSYELNNGHANDLPTSYDIATSTDVPFAEKEDAVFIGWSDTPYGETHAQYVLGNGQSGDKVLYANYVSATITDGVLEDISDYDIKEIVIPSYVSDINDQLFKHLTHLQNVFVYSGNVHFESKNNLLIKDKNIAFAYPIAYSSTAQIVNLPYEITAIGKNAFNGTQIKEIHGTSLITKVDNFAFNGCEQLTVCDFSSISYVGSYAFQDTKITETFLDINYETLSYIGDKAFSGTRIADVTLGDSITHIGDEAFSNNSYIIHVQIYPHSSCELGHNIFYHSTNIKTLEVDSNILSVLLATSFMDGDTRHIETIKVIGSAAISKNIWNHRGDLVTLDLSESTIPSIGQSAFSYDTSLENVILPTSLMNVSTEAFNNCESLTSVNFTDLSNLISIKSGAFSGTSLTSIDLSNSPHLVVEDHAFSNNLNLSSIKMIHGQVNTQMSSVFDLCGNIQNVEYLIKETDGPVNIPDHFFSELNNVNKVTIKYLGEDTDKVINFGVGCFKNDLSLKEVELVNCKTNEISDYCFENCAIFDDAYGCFSNLTKYGNEAFFGCTKLSLLTIEGCESIGRYTFAGCYSLTLGPSEEFAVPSTVQTIGEGAFEDITGSIYIDFTEEEVQEFAQDADSPWWLFASGFAGSFNYKTTV